MKVEVSDLVPMSEVISPAAGVDFVKIQQYFPGNAWIQLKRSIAFVVTVRWD